MKIITKDNFDQDVFAETVVDENVNKSYGEEFVELFNNKHWDESPDTYLALVEDDYKLYNGYADLV